KAAGKHVINIAVDGQSVPVTMFPPEGRWRSWYAYWKGLTNRVSTRTRDLTKAVEVVTAMLNGSDPSPAATLTDDELIEIQRRHFETQGVGRKKPKSSKASLREVLSAIAAFQIHSGLSPISVATAADCEQFMKKALTLPRNWRQAHSKIATPLSPFTVYKWLGALQGAFQRANRNAGRACIRSVVPAERLLTTNPWNEFAWIPKPEATVRHFTGEELVDFLAHLRTAWPTVTAGELMLKVFLWSWGRRQEVAGLTWDALRLVDDECHLFMAGKWRVEKWFRIPRPVYDELLAHRTSSPFVFAAWSDQLRSHHISQGRADIAAKIRGYSPENAGRWFYERMSNWSEGEGTVHMLRKTAMRFARIGEDLSEAVARDASVTTAVMLGHYAPDHDPEMRAKSNRMFRRIRDGFGIEVAKAFGYEQSPTEALEQRLREATLAKDWELVGRLSAELARQGRQAG
ncbi:MAG: hypothetical protein ACR2IT_07010, partial [Pirellulales bacterium]